MDKESRKETIVPCPTCSQDAKWGSLHGTAVEQIMWHDYPAPYDRLRDSTK